MLRRYLQKSYYRALNNNLSVKLETRYFASSGSSSGSNTSQYSTPPTLEETRFIQKDHGSLRRLEKEQLEINKDKLTHKAHINADPEQSISMLHRVSISPFTTDSDNSQQKNDQTSQDQKNYSQKSQDYQENQKQRGLDQHQRQRTPEEIDQLRDEVRRMREMQKLTEPQFGRNEIKHKHQYHIESEYMEPPTGASSQRQSRTGRMSDQRSFSTFNRF
eukprot:403341947